MVNWSQLYINKSLLFVVEILRQGFSLSDILVCSIFLLQYINDSNFNIETAVGSPQQLHKNSLTLQVLEY